MNSGRLLPLLVCFAGCNGLFGIDVRPIEPPRHGPDASDGADGGSTPDPGESSGNGGQTEPSADGGTRANSAGEAGADAGAGTPSGAGGGSQHQSGAGGHTSGHGGAGAGKSAASGAGKSAAGGAATVTFPEVGDPCTEGTVACLAYKNKQTLTCYQGSWSLGEKCGTNEFCDSRTGACGSIYAGCEGEDGGYQFCLDDGFTLVTCGPDLVTAERETCPYGCGNQGVAVACTPAGLGWLTVEEAPAIEAAASYWPGTSVPVCFASAEVGDEWGMVEDEIGRTWGRDAGIRFDGFGACSPDVTDAIVVKFRAADDFCTGVLGGVDRIGYPGSGGNVNITLCLAYDQVGGKGTTSEGLLRLVARHEFGHALGFDDLSDHLSSSEFMSRALIGSQSSNYPFLSQHVSLVQRAYGFKPSGAFVDLRGFCLTSGTEPPSFANCDASAAQAFHFENDQIHGEDEQTCLQAAPDGTLAFVACAPAGSSPDPAQTWHPADFQVRGYAGMCLYAYYGMEEGDVAVKPCEQVQDTGIWQFESLDGADRFRLQDSSGQCLAMVPSGTTSVGIEPADCDQCDEVDVRCSFGFTGDGQIARDDYCLTEPSLAPETGEDGFTLPTAYTANVDTCSLKRRAAWSLRGRFVNGNDQMLVVGTRDEQYRLTAVAADRTTPIPEFETFEYYPRAK